MCFKCFIVEIILPSNASPNAFFVIIESRQLKNRIYKLIVDTAIDFSKEKYVHHIFFQMVRFCEF